MTLIFSIHYFLWYGALTSIFGYEGVYARYYTNASTMLFGYLKMLLPFATVVVTPIVCSMADRRRTHRLYFASALVIAQIALSCLALIPIISDKDERAHPLDIRSCNSQNQQTNASLLIWPWILYCVATLAYDLSIGVTTCLSDSFAVLQAEETGTSFGRVIVWGTFGWATSAIVLSLVNQIKFLPRLLPGVLYGIIILSTDIVIISLWKNRTDFLLDRIPKQAAQTLTSSSSMNHPDPSDYLPLNESAKINLGPEIGSADGGATIRKTKNTAQYVNSKQQSDQLKASQLMKREAFSNDTDTSALSVSTIDSEIDFPRQDESNGAPQVEANNTVAKKQQINEDHSDQKATSFRIQFILFCLIIKRRKSLIRYLILFCSSGFFMSMQWNYFFMYLEQIYCEKFELISALSMLGQGLLGELPFFVLSRKFIDHLGRSNTLSVSFVTIGLRFLLYRYLLPNVSMFLIFIADCLQGPNYGLFYVVMTEVGLEYSFCDDETIELMALRGEIDRNDQRQVDSLRLSLRSTIQSIAFACYEGLGLGLGSLVGGLVIAKYSFETLWTVMAAAAIVVGLLNVLIELICRDRRRPEPRAESSEAQEFMEARRLGTLKRVASPRPLPVPTPLSPIRFKPTVASKMEQLKVAAEKRLGGQEARKQLAVGAKRRT